MKFYTTKKPFCHNGFIERKVYFLTINLYICIIIRFEPKIIPKSVENMDISGHIKCFGKFRIFYIIKIHLKYRGLVLIGVINNYQG